MVSLQYKQGGVMIEWTCLECENKYTNGIDGDAEERMCFKCLNKGDDNG